MERLAAVRIRRTSALVLLIVLLATTVVVGISLRRFGHRDSSDWLTAFCLTQSIILAAYAIYGPGRPLIRFSFVCAWGMGLGFALAMLNLISTLGRTSLAAGAILVISGVSAPALMFALHRWRTGATVVLGDSVSTAPSTEPPHQFSLKTLMILTAAFAVAGVVARSALQATPDPFGNEHDILILQAWLGFFPCLAAAPIVLIVFRPSWRSLLAVVFILLITCIEPFLLGLAAPYMFEDVKMVAPSSISEFFRTVLGEAAIYNGQAFIATLIYALLARAAGIRMILPDQSNDRKPNPAGEPATEAVGVHD